MSAAAPAIGSRDRLSVTFLFSLIFHGVLALGLTFAYEKPAPSLPALDVILVQSASGQKPTNADFLAQANNTGGGDSERATAAPEFDEIRVRAERAQGRRERARDAAREQVAEFGRGDEIAGGTELGAPRAVVAEAGRVQREFHVARERNRPGGGDLVADQRGELAGVRTLVGIGLGQVRAQGWSAAAFCGTLGNGRPA